MANAPLVASDDVAVTESVHVRDLTFGYGGANILEDLALSLPHGSRCLLIGLNGAGKTTLLRILAGKRLTKGTVNVLGRQAYHDTPTGISYMGPEWANNPVTRTDVTVSALLKSLDASRFPERTAKLMDLLDIDIDWHMNKVSDGERRRVQILLGLLEPFQLLLLDEVTVDLDVLVRRKLLEFLKQDTAPVSGGKPGTIIYATHIFDGLGSWPTHVAHLRCGKVIAVHPFDNFPELQDAMKSSGFDSPLLKVVECWLADDLAATKAKRQELASSKTQWDRLSEDVRKHGDKFYNYWN